MLCRCVAWTETLCRLNCVAWTETEGSDPFLLPSDTREVARRVNHRGRRRDLHSEALCLQGSLFHLSHFTSSIPAGWTKAVRIETDRRQTGPGCSHHLGLRVLGVVKCTRSKEGHCVRREGTLNRAQLSTRYLTLQSSHRKPKWVTGFTPAQTCELDHHHREQCPSQPCSDKQEGTEKAFNTWFATRGVELTFWVRVSKHKLFTTHFGWGRMEGGGRGGGERQTLPP